MSSVVMIGHKSIPSRQGGIEIVVEKLSVGLSERGYTVEVYNRGEGLRGHGCAHRKESGASGVGRVRLRTIPTIKTGGYNALIYAYLATIRALFGSYDIYHYHAEGPCAMLWLLRLFHKRIVVTVHGLDWQRAKWGRMASGVILGGEKQAVKYADEIIVLSRNVQKYFLDTYGRETVYIPNGVSRHIRVPAERICEEYGLEARGYILFVARLVPEKGAHYLIEAFKRQNSNMKLVIAGGSGQADDYMEHVGDMAQGDERIVMTGFVQGRVLEELYSNAYIYVQPSDVEGMSLSLLEAMSYGNCCLVSDISENTEVVGDMGVTFRKGDVEHLADRLAMLIKDKERVEHLRESSADYICARYSWDEMIAKTEAVYENTYSK